MWNGLNRIWNTAAIPIRMWWTVVTTSADLLNTFYTFSKEWFEVLASTTKNIKDVLLWAWNHGKWYHKAMNIPLSPIIATWTVFEWVIRSTVQPIINWVVNTWNTGVNTIKNTWKWSFGRLFSKKPISDFSYNHLKTRPLTLNNWFSKLQFARWKSGWWDEKKAAAIVVKDKEVKLEKNEKNDLEKNNDKKDKKTPDSDEKNDKGTKDNNKKEEKWEKWEKEKWEKDSKLEEWYRKAQEILKDSKHGSKIYESIRARIPSMAFVFDKSSSVWKIDEKTNEIIVWLQVPSDERQIAPLNTKKNSLEQSRHVLLHEMWHIMIHNNLWNKKVEKALDLAQKVFEKDKITISPLAQLDIYKNAKDKAKEDITEMLALYANKHDDLDKYLWKLTSDKKEDEEYRKKFKLAKISKEDANVIKDACESLVEEYSKGKIIKMDTRPASEESKMAA